MSFTAFLDFEFSQGPTFPKEEIISVGCVIFDENLQEIDNFYSLCCPRVNKIISPRISRITKIYQKDINKAPTFIKMMNRFIKVIKKYPDIKFYSWGGDDWKVLKDEMEVNNSFWIKKYIPEIIDLQIEVFDSIKNENKKLWSTPKRLTAMTTFYNTKELVAHNALNDARMLGEVYKAKKLRGKYFFDKGEFEYMESVSEKDMEIANKTAKEMKDYEKKCIIKRMRAVYGKNNMTRILDGNLYHMIEPVLDEPLFTKRKHRNYSDYVIEIMLDEKNSAMIIKIISKDKIVYKSLDIEQYKPLITSILHMYCGNRRRQKNWK